VPANVVHAGVKGNHDVYKCVYIMQELIHVTWESVGAHQGV